jgi:hypothetical protein
MHGQRHLQSKCSIENTYVYTFPRVCMVYVCVCVYVFMCVCMPICIYAYVNTCIHFYTLVHYTHSIQTLKHLLFRTRIKTVPISVFLFILFQSNTSTKKPAVWSPAVTCPSSVASRCHGMPVRWSCQDASYTLLWLLVQMGVPCGLPWNIACTLTICARIRRQDVVRLTSAHDAVNKGIGCTWGKATCNMQGPTDCTTLNRHSQG